MGLILRHGGKGCLEKGFRNGQLVIPSAESWLLGGGGGGGEVGQVSKGRIMKGPTYQLRNLDFILRRRGIVEAFYHLVFLTGI